MGRIPRVVLVVACGALGLGCGSRVGLPRPVIQVPQDSIVSDLPLAQGGGSPDSGYAPSAAWAPGSLLGVSFYDAGRGMLRFAEQTTGGVWTVEDVDGPDAGAVSALAYLPGTATPYVAYGFRATGEGGAGIRAAWRAEGSWRTRALAYLRHPPASLSLGIDARGIVKIAFLEPEGGVRFLDWDRAEAEDSQIVDSGTPPLSFMPPYHPEGWSAMVLGADALPVVAYFEASQGMLALARIDPLTGLWSRSRLEWVDVRGEPVAVDPDPVLDQGPCTLQPPYYVATLAHLSSGDSSATVIDRDGAGLHADQWAFCTLNQIGLTADAYGAGSIYTADYQRTDVSSDEEGAFVSSAVDPAGFVHLAFYDRTRASLEYAEETSPGWAVSTVDALGQVGAGTAVGFDGRGHPIIAYRSLSELALKFAHQGGAGAWRIRFLDADGDTGQAPSLVSAEEGTFAVVYRGVRRGTPYLRVLRIPTESIEPAPSAAP